MLLTRPRLSLLCADGIHLILAANKLCDVLAATAIKVMDFV